MRNSIIGWVIIGLVAFTWEMLGVFGVWGLWPLTWDIRDGFVHSESFKTVVFLFIAWLIFHFFLSPVVFGKK